MRYESSVLSLSWIPSEAISGMPRLPFGLGLTHYDDPPPDTVTDPMSLLTSDRVRLVNQLRAWVEVEAGRIVDCGYSGGGHLNMSTVRIQVDASHSLPSHCPTCSMNPRTTSMESRSCRPRVAVPECLLHVG